MCGGVSRDAYTVTHTPLRARACVCVCVCVRCVCVREGGEYIGGRTSFVMSRTAEMPALHRWVINLLPRACADESAASYLPRGTKGDEMGRACQGR